MSFVALEKKKKNHLFVKVIDTIDTIAVVQSSSCSGNCSTMVVPNLSVSEEH